MHENRVSSYNLYFPVFAFRTGTQPGVSFYDISVDIFVSLPELRGGIGLTYFQLSKGGSKDTRINTSIEISGNFKAIKKTMVA